MTDGTGSETYSYDSAGRVTQLSKMLANVTYNIGYEYDVAGALKKITYPSGHAVNHTFDAIGRLNKITRDTTDYLTINSADYTPAGQVKGLTLGNGVKGTFTYNDHLQVASLRYQKPNLTDLLNLAYKYAAPNGGNNGQVQGIDNQTGGTVIGRQSVTYAYDDWSRLKTAQTNDLTAPPNPDDPKTWGLSWNYDRYGNRLSQTLSGGTLPVTAVQLNIDEATNRINENPPYTYDASGNLTSDGVNMNYRYDAAGRMVFTNYMGPLPPTTMNVYDGNGLRVQKWDNANGTVVYLFSGSKVIAEYNWGAQPNQPNKEYIYAGSQLLATIVGSTTTYSHADHLSIRVQTDSLGNPLRRFGHLPFGDTWYETGAGSKWKFTSYERDAESGLDYATFRFESWRLGRFMSPDPVAGSTANPQSLNRYSYVANNPTNLIDPLGLCFTTDASPDMCPLLDWGILDVSRGSWQGPFGCVLDGFFTPCSLVETQVWIGAAVNCPNCGVGDYVDQEGNIRSVSQKILVGEYMGDLKEVDMVVGRVGEGLVPMPGNRAGDFYLLRTHDCYDANHLARFSDYTLYRNSTGKPAGSGYTIVENHTNLSVAPPMGMSRQQGTFQDKIGTQGSIGVTASQRYFTVTDGKQWWGVVPVQYSDGSQYKVEGIWMHGERTSQLTTAKVFVNGKLAPPCK